ncbi:MAG TPA: 3-oxoacid CoA-transferase subunit A [Herbaspirillum sp.]
MINKYVATLAEAISDMRDGHSLLVGGFGSAGLPTALLDAILEHGVKDLVVISNNAGYDREGVASLIAHGRVRKLICSYPLTEGATAFRDAYRDKKIELELVPQGTLVERIRCAGAGLGGFLSPIGVDTILAEGKPLQRFNNQDYLIEAPLRADFALLRARTADRIGNLIYHLTGRNFNPVMATAADVVIAEVDELLELGALNPERIITSGIFVDRIVLTSSPQKQYEALNA